MKLSYSITLIAMVAILIVASIATFMTVRDKEPDVVSPVSAERFDQRITYVSPKTNETVDITFGDGSALFSGFGFDRVAVKLVSSDTGPRYENKKENLIIVPKGNDVLVYEGRRELFFGTDANAVATGTQPPVIITPEPEELDVATTTATTTNIAEDSATTSDETTEE